MKTRKKIITRFADNLGDDTALSEKLRAQAESHKKIASMLKSAYAHEISGAKMDFLEQRVMAHVAQMEKPTFCEKIADTFGFLICKKKSFVWGLIAATAIVIITFTSFSNRPAIAHTPDYESFVIYETENGDGFVKYFKYKVESQDEN